VGIKSPSSGKSIRGSEYSMLAKPHWVDAIYSTDEKGLELKDQTRIMAARGKDGHAVAGLPSMSIWLKRFLFLRQKKYQKIQNCSGRRGKIGRGTL